LLASRSILKLEDHPFSSVRDCLFDIFVAALNIWRPSLPFATCGRAISRFSDICEFLTAPIRATCPAHFLFLYCITVYGEEYLRSSSLCNFLHPPVTTSLIGPNFLLSTPFSSTLNLCPSVDMTDQVSHP